MKKTALFVICTMILIGGLGLDVQARSSGSRFLLNLGTVSDETMRWNPFFYSIGVSFDYYVGETFFISPEFSIVDHNVNFSSLYIQPALILNCNFNGLIFGGGISRLILVGSGDSMKGFLPRETSWKFNFGYSSGNFKTLIHVLLPVRYLLSFRGIGMSVGYYFW